MSKNVVLRSLTSKTFYVFMFNVYYVYVWLLWLNTWIIWYYFC